MNNIESAGQFEKIFVHKTKENNYQLVFSYDNSKQITIYDLINKKIIQKLPSHSCITKIKYYFDFKRKRDLLLSASYDGTLKVWNISNNYSNILIISKTRENTDFSPSCLVFEENDFFLLTSNYDKKLKCYSSRGSGILSLNYNYKANYLTETFYYGEKIYLIIAGIPGIYLYDWCSKQIHRHLLDRYKEEAYHLCFEVNQSKEGSLDLIECNSKRIIRLRDFFRGNLKKIFSINTTFNSMITWNSKFLLTGDIEHLLRLFNLETGVQIKEFKSHFDFVWYIKKIELSSLSEC